MTKKKDEVARAEELANRLFPGDAQASAEHVGELLEDLGCDRTELRARARAAAEALFHESIAEGRTPPPFLKRAMESLADANHFPTDAKAAASVADRLIDSLERPRAVRGSGRLLEAARQAGGTGPTESDSVVKERLRADLRRRLAGSDDDGSE